MIPFPPGSSLFSSCQTASTFPTPYLGFNIQEACLLHSSRRADRASNSRRCYDRIPFPGRPRMQVVGNSRRNTSPCCRNYGYTVDTFFSGRYLEAERKLVPSSRSGQPGGVLPRPGIHWTTRLCRTQVSSTRKYPKEGRKSAWFLSCHP